MCYKPGISLPFSDVVYSRIVLSVSDVLQSRNLIVIVQAVQAQAPAIVCVACLELHCRFLTLLSGVGGWRNVNSCTSGFVFRFHGSCRLCSCRLRIYSSSVSYCILPSNQRIVASAVATIQEKVRTAILANYHCYSYFYCCCNCLCLWSAIF